jgi:hypothetical protein
MKGRGNQAASSEIDRCNKFDTRFPNFGLHLVRTNPPVNGVQLYSIASQVARLSKVTFGDLPPRSVNDMQTDCDDSTGLQHVLLEITPRDPESLMHAFV